MEKISVGVVEDEFIIAEDLRGILEKLSYSVAFVAGSAEQALAFLTKQKVDIVLLDISLKGEMDGTQLGKLIAEHFKIPFLFVTAYADALTVARAKEARPLGYVVKPFSLEDIYTAIEIALVQSNRQQGDASPEAASFFHDSIYVKNGNVIDKVSLEDIRYLVADGNYTVLHTAARTYMMRRTLKELTEVIPPGQFTRIHKSYIVRIAAITAIDQQFVYLADVKLPIGRAYQDTFAAIKKASL